MKQLEGYTVIELIGAMLITGVVMTLVYWGYLTIHQQLNRYSQKMNVLREIMQVDLILKDQFEGADSVMLSVEGLDYYSNGVVKTHVNFESDYIIVSSSTYQDTFQLVTSISHVSSDDYLLEILINDTNIKLQYSGRAKR